MRKFIKEAFVVIGKEGSTLDGAGFIQKLWNDANSHFSEVEHLAKKDTKGMPRANKVVKSSENGVTRYVAGYTVFLCGELFRYL